jgi:hypothetical protein
LPFGEISFAFLLLSRLLFIYLFIHREQGAVSVLSVVDVDP